MKMTFRRDNTYGAEFSRLFYVGPCGIDCGRTSAETSMKWSFCKAGRYAGSRDDSHTAHEASGLTWPKIYALCNILLQAQP